MARVRPIIGITGGIGSGKTFVCELFKELGIAIFNSDQQAGWLMENNKQLIHKIKQLFGEKAYLENKKLNKAHIAQIVFNNKEMLASLNLTVHPFVFKHFDLWYSQQESAYVIKESALLIETMTSQKVDELIYVYADTELRIQRAMLRDNKSREQIEARINKQKTDTEFRALADFVIDNSGTKSVIQQVYSVHQTIIKKYNLV